MPPSVRGLELEIAHVASDTGSRLHTMCPCVCQCGYQPLSMDRRVHSSFLLFQPVLWGMSSEYSFETLCKTACGSPPRVSAPGGRGAPVGLGRVLCPVLPEEGPFPFLPRDLLGPLLAHRAPRLVAPRPRPC